MIKTIEYKGKSYPFFQATGNAAQFIIPFALKVCEGIGYDIGFGREEWKLPRAIGIEKDTMGCNANHLPDGEVDYIFSSHCLEHLWDWTSVLDHWIEHLRIGGVLFLYLPCYSQEYWRPWNNRKHLHVFTPQIVKDFMEDRGFVNIFNSDRDLYDSFAIFGEKGRKLD